MEIPFGLKYNLLPGLKDVLPIGGKPIAAEFRVNC